MADKQAEFCLPYVPVDHREFFRFLRRRESNTRSALLGDSILLHLFNALEFGVHNDFNHLVGFPCQLALHRKDESYRKDDEGIENSLVPLDLKQHVRLPSDIDLLGCPLPLGGE